MKSPGNYDSYLVFDLEQFLHRHLFVLGDPPGSVHTPEAAAAAVLVEVDVIELDLHEGGAWRRHLIMTLSTSSASEMGVTGKEGSLVHSTKSCTVTQTYSCWARRFKEQLYSGTHH